MVITKTPFRISFFGGGSDYPVWYENNEEGGVVLSASIDKHCYISCRHLPPFFDHKHRIVWSRLENVRDVEEIQHPLVKEALKFLNVQKGLEIHHDADLPARSGLGASSSFAVGLLNALYALNGKIVLKKQLALDAIHIEQERLRGNVGCQDQVAATFGGFNKIKFGGPHKFIVQPVPMEAGRLNSLHGHLMLFFTGLARNASEVAVEQIKNTPRKVSELKRMVDMVEEAVKILAGGDLDDFGRLLHESWQIKKSLSSQITNSRLDEIYEAGFKAGALGGKLLGAGGGGFMLFFVKPELQERVKEKFKDLLHVPFRFESLGTQIIYYAPDQVA